MSKRVHDHITLVGLPRTEKLARRLDNELPFSQSLTAPAYTALDQEM